MGNKLGRNQRLYLEILCAQPAGTTVGYVSFGSVGGAERVGISLAKRGLVDGPTEAPQAGYAKHTINATGRQWVHDNIGPICGHRWVLTGKEVPHDEYVEYIEKNRPRKTLSKKAFSTRES